MTDDVTRLLAGPRGRELCLATATAWELAQGDERRLGPLGDAVFCLDVGQPGRVFFGPCADDLRPTTEDDVLRELRALPACDLDGFDAREALQQVVLSARYWQEPDRLDAVLARPDVVEALTPWARLLADSPLASWWLSPAVLDEQYSTHCPGHRPQTTTAAERLVEWTRETRDDERQARGRPTDPRVSYSGHWWSAPVTLPSSTRPWPGTTEPLGAELTEDAVCDADDVIADRVQAPADARVLEIDCADAWIDLCRRFPEPVTASRRHDWYRCTGRVGDWVIPDWPAVARLWDAVHLPLLAWLELAGRALPVDDGCATLVAGWSPDETYWFVDL